MAARVVAGADQSRNRARRGSRGGRPPAFDREAYKHRNVIERCFNHLRQWRGIATRYEKTAQSYEAAVTLASLLTWARYRMTSLVAVADSRAPARRAHSAGHRAQEAVEDLIGGEGRGDRHSEAQTAFLPGPPQQQRKTAGESTADHRLR